MVERVGNRQIVERLKGDELLIPSFAEFQAVQRATLAVVRQRPESQAHFDMTRARPARSALRSFFARGGASKYEANAYLADAVGPQSGYEFDEATYNRLTRFYGPSAMRIAVIDRNISQFIARSNGADRILGAGGLCAQETADTRIKNQLAKRKNGKELVRTYSEHILAQSPTWTQVTGAVIPTNGATILYDETFPWYLKIQEEGVENAKEKTQQSYDRAVAAAARYAYLVNPFTSVVRVPFEDLDLAERGYLKDWFEVYKPYAEGLAKRFDVDPPFFQTDNFTKAWVLATYHHPQILDIVKGVIYEREPQLFRDLALDQYTLYARGKQIDHLTIERENQYIVSLVLNAPIDEARVEQVLTKQSNLQMAAIVKWILNRGLEYPVGLAGFLDFNWRGDIMHETPIIDPDRVKLSDDVLLHELLTSPLRMQGKNLNEAIDFLRRFTDINLSNGVDEETAQEVLLIMAQYDQLEKKVSRMQIRTEGLSILLQMLGGEREFFATKISSTQDLKETLNSLLQKYFKQRDSKKNNNTEVIKQLEVAMQQLEFGLTMPENAEGILFQLQSDTDLSFARAFLQRGIEIDLERVMTDLEAMRYDFELATQQRSSISEAVALSIAKHTADPLSKHVVQVPLIDNLFFSYVQQLNFIPMIRRAYLQMVSIEQDLWMPHDEKCARVAEISKEIFPYVEEAIRYCMEEGREYPYEMRFENT